VFTKILNGVMKVLVVIVVLAAMALGITEGGMSGLVIFGLVVIMGLVLLSVLGVFAEMAENIRVMKEYITSGNLNNQRYVGQNQGQYGYGNNSNGPSNNYPH
jgi:hypothetical protein